jgi:HK97 family phage major capsid protein
MPKMASIDELIATIEVELEGATKRRDKALAEIKAIIAVAQQEGRSNLSEEEDTRIKDLTDSRERAKSDIEGIKGKLGNANRVKAEEIETERQARETAPTPAAKRVPKKYDELARVGQEERTYHPGNDRKGGQFLRDVARQFLYNDVQANERLSRHMHEERLERAGQIQRAAGDTTTTNWAGLVVPQYLTDMYAPNIAALRPFANICNQHDLPADGMSVNISRVTTASSVALQASELTAVSATSLDDTLLTENVQTAAGQQTLSRQAIDRGTGVEAVVVDDLFRRYATALDATLITQATTGLSAVAQSTAFTTGTPTFMSTTAADSLYGKIQSATAGVEAALLAYGYPTHAIMHSRRWYWIQSKVNSVWPGITQPNIPVQAGGTSTTAGYNQGVRGILPNGLAVIVDNNIATNNGTATNEDEIYIVPSSECHLWEDPGAPAFIRAEQPAAANLGVLLVLYAYFAYSFRRYTNGMGKVNGTGLTTPTF